MTIEERAVKAWGLTNDPCCCIYMLKDGTMLNGSYEGFQRDRDHREIGQFYKHSKKEQPGDASLYIYKFMRRGNLRVGCHETGYVIELLTTPTKEQISTMIELYDIAKAYGIEFAIGIVNRKHVFELRFVHLYGYIKHLLRYHMMNEYDLQNILYTHGKEYLLL